MVNQLQEVVKNKLPADIDKYDFLAGLIGGERPSTYSKSPQIWGACFTKFGINAIYLPLDVPEKNLEACIDALRKNKKVRGFNATIPYKEQTQLFDKVVKDTAAIGAVNTVVRTPEGKLVGYNTDGEGEVLDLALYVNSLKDKKVLLIGAGGAASAVAFALVKRGVVLRIVNRTVSHGQELADKLNAFFKPPKKVEYAAETQTQEWAPWANIIINTTTKGHFGIGLKDFSALWSTTPKNREKSLEIAKKVPKETLFADIIYTPSETVFLRHGKQTGHKVTNGLGMLVHQAVIAFEKIFSPEVQSKGISRQQITAVMKVAIGRA
jgi:shikimate dehydrogenase